MKKYFLFGYDLVNLYFNCDSDISEMEKQWIELLSDPFYGKVVMFDESATIEDALETMFGWSDYAKITPTEYNYLIQLVPDPVV